MQTQCAFAAQEDIHFSLLGDESRAISQAYGVLWPVLNVYRHLEDVLSYLKKHPPAPLGA